MKLVFALLLAATSSIAWANEETYRMVLHDCLLYQKSEEACATAGDFNKCMSIKYRGTQHPQSAANGFFSPDSIFSLIRRYKNGSNCQKIAKEESAGTDRADETAKEAEVKKRAAFSALTPEQQQIEKDFPSWPMEIKFKGKQIFINEAPVTDQEGNTYLTDSDLKDYIRTAKSTGKEFPIQLFQKKWRGIQ